MKKGVKWRPLPRPTPRRALAPCPPSPAGSPAILVVHRPSDITQPGYARREQRVAAEKDLDLQFIWFDLGTFSNYQAILSLGLGQTLKRDRPFAQIPALPLTS